MTHKPLDHTGRPVKHRLALQKVVMPRGAKRGRPAGSRAGLRCLNEICHVVRKPVRPFEAFCTEPEQEAAETPQDSDHPVFDGEGTPQSPSVWNAWQPPQDAVHAIFQSPDGHHPHVAVSPPASTEHAALDVEDVHVYAHHLVSVGLQALNTPVAAERQACFCIPQLDQAKQQLNLRNFCLPAVRMIELADGAHLTWWCTCDHTLESSRSIFAYRDYPNMTAEFLDGRADQCLHVKALEVSA